jgi:glycerol-3-phosphate acyltransferase PlsY
VLIPVAVLGGQSTSTLEALAGMLAILGHSFTPVLRFKGGKGVATGAGAFAVLSPLATLLALGVFAAVLALTRIVALGSVLAALTLPLAAWFLGAARSITIAAGIVSILVIARHRANIARLLGGRESHLEAGSRK